MGEIIPNKIHY